MILTANDETFVDSAPVGDVSSGDDIESLFLDTVPIDHMTLLEADFRSVTIALSCLGTIPVDYSPMCL